MGVKNTRPGIFSPPFGDRDTNLGNGIYENLTAVSYHFCNILFSIGEDSFETRWMTSLCKLPRRFQDSQEKFQSFRSHPYR